MNILHITAHMGDGAGKAIGGLAVLGSADGRDTHKILLLDEPRKMNHIDYCRDRGIEFLPRREIQTAISWADVVVISWWGGRTMEGLLDNFPAIPCRVLLWSHKNGFYDPPLPEELVNQSDQLLVTSPITLTNPRWKEGTLVYGFGSFDPITVIPKESYALSPLKFVIGYVGMPSYKRFPANATDYFKAVLKEVPSAQFVLGGEYSDEFQFSIEQEGLSSHVTLLGWVGNVYDLLQTFDVFGYLLREDTSATTENSVLEAMAAGLPIVMPRKPVGRYVVGENNGFLVETPEGFACAMKKLYDSESLRREKGLAGRAYVLKTYDSTTNLQRFRDACDRAISHPKFIHYFGGNPYGYCCTEL